MPLVEMTNKRKKFGLKMINLMSFNKVTYDVFSR